jgi:hypothetical protein
MGKSLISLRSAARPPSSGSSNPGLFARGAEALRARLRHAAGPPALALAGITTVEAANSFLKKV